MNARELHNWMRNIADTEPDADILAVTRGFYETILRALDLFARVEESTDELVRELRGIALFLAYRDAFESERTVDKAAAALVALKAERDRLKAHAEAMAEEIANQYGSGRNVLSVALDAKEARIKELEGALLRTGAWEIAPCCICGYNGPGYYQPDTHACANRAREALK